MEPEVLINEATALALNYGPKLISAIAIWIIGGGIIKLIIGGAVRAMDKSKTDPSLKPFVRGIVGTLLKVMLAITALGMLGIEMTSFIAILAAAGLAIGMALSGTLQNFAGGIMILLFKPFKVGDVIDAQGYVGSVKEIQIFNTLLKTPDNKIIILPNGGLSTSSMVNISAEPLRRVDWTIAVSYGEDLDHVREVIKRLSDADTRIHKDPEVFIAVAELADSSVNFAVRAWVDAADYWGVFFDMNEQVYKVFAKEGLNIPYPQMDVHVHQDG